MSNTEKKEKKFTLSELTLSLPEAASSKIQYFIRLSFNWILQLINGTSSDLQKLPRFFNGAAIAPQFLKF